MISLGEIEKGIIKLRVGDPARAEKLTLWLSKIEQRFAGRILRLDAAVLSAWPQLSAQAELAGRPLPVMDCWLMASAQCRGLTVVTRNVQDFELVPQIFNPWGLS